MSCGGLRESDQKNTDEKGTGGPTKKKQVQSPQRQNTKSKGHTFAP